MATKDLFHNPYPPLSIVISDYNYSHYQPALTVYQPTTTNLTTNVTLRNPMDHTCIDTPVHPYRPYQPYRPCQPCQPYQPLCNHRSLPCLPHHGTLELEVLQTQGPLCPAPRAPLRGWAASAMSRMLGTRDLGFTMTLLRWLVMMVTGGR